MAKTKTRTITLTDSMGNFLFRKHAVDKEDFEFTGLASLRNLLTNEKARILHVIKEQKPESIYGLAKVLKRDFKSVTEDLKLLERFGFIEFVETKKNNRIRHKPELLINSLTINIEI